jgi:hypothetical protein
MYVSHDRIIVLKNSDSVKQYHPETVRDRGQCAQKYGSELGASAPHLRTVSCYPSASRASKHLEEVRKERLARARGRRQGRRPRRLSANLNLPLTASWYAGAPSLLG